ncbi:apolipoprotein N-acyltransferase [Poriferisphaera sp. WC338]|uniref:apolipoprotein N-acyltransferase n=1 Tax=Poriferisphaera sp. WC338 TaxID=3425129 RepID=UPI003D81A305
MSKEQSGMSAEEGGVVPVKRSRSRVMVGGGVQGVWAHLVLFGVSALLFALSFPNPGWWWCAYVALVGWGYVCVRGEKLWRVFWTGFVVWLLFWLLRAKWLVPVTVGGYVGASVVEAAYMAIAGVVLMWLARRYPRASMTVLLPVVWVSVEFARARFPFNGFGWFLLGYSQGNWRPGQQAGVVVQTASVAGVWAVSFVVAMTNGLIVDLLTQRLVHMRRSGKKKVRKTVWSAVVIWVAVMVLVVMHGLRSVYWYDEQREQDWQGAEIAVVQTNVSQMVKNEEDGRSISKKLLEEWDELFRLTRATVYGADVKPGLVVWPETVVPGYLNEASLAAEDAGMFDGWMIAFRPRTHVMQVGRLAKELGVNLMVGGKAGDDWKMVEVKGYGAFPEPEKKWNSAFLFYADGMQAGVRYDKQILVPFGEYLPVISGMPWAKKWFLRTFSPYGEDVDYELVPGEQQTLFDIPVANVFGQGEESEVEVELVRVVTPICYEDVVPRQVRGLAYEEVDGEMVKRADVIVNLTNSAWYDGQSQRLQHMQIAGLRSIENRLPTARSVNTGVSGFFDSMGCVTKVVEQGGKVQYVAGWANEWVRFDERVSGYGRIGNAGVWGAVGALCVLIVVGAVRGVRMG